ncbi:helix-turn-helix domain-containing protein [uncultured Methylobacterium sp.]|jgi:AraC family transcriptional activator of pobA|uniref:helix-turn-helix domain-containing protein n=1 Tax=uncultured Methylobacterium sp. TaxID=157278 RepID=UPI0026255500|nr:helix-turn-helix domain-containing protein [uncultured Methylobacterium sp.]
MKTASARGIPVFGLYGEVAEATIPDFVHAERIGSSASLYGWEIGVHRHGRLSQALVVTQGGGVSRIDGREDAIAAPWLIWIPAGVVHAFSFRPGTDGVVLSLADDFLAAVIAGDHEAARLREAADALFGGRLGSPDEIDLDLRGLLDALVHEVSGSLPGSVSVVSALAKLLLVGVLRTRAARAITEPAALARADLHRRFRRLVEAHLREHWPVARFAAELGVSPDRLHAACTEAAGRAPQVILHDRLMLEAKRSLIYTALPVAKIAFDLGFNDPAYFSRFFAARAGLGPAAYRKRGHAERPP